MEEPHSPFVRRHKKAEDNVDNWMMSYADMITLLLCFFIIFVSTSEPKKDRLAAATSGLRAKFGSVDITTPFLGSFRAIQGIIDSNDAYRNLSVERTEKGLVMELSANVFFQADSAEFNPARTPMLAQLAGALKEEPFKDYIITIEGHTSDLQPLSGLYTTNWELSAARATRMVRYFIEQGLDDKRMVAVAHADTAPVVPNVGPDGKPIRENRDKNARMVVKLERRW